MLPRNPLVVFVVLLPGNEKATMQQTADGRVAETVWGLLFVGCLTSQQHASVSQGRICPYAPQGSTSLLPKLSVTLKVSARTSYAWVGSRVHFRSSDDVTLLEFTSPVDSDLRRLPKFH